MLCLKDVEEVVLRDMALKAILRHVEALQGGHVDYPITVHQEGVYAFKMVL